ncbi:MAG: hypothetical protein WCX74_03180 [Candidatus Paceibacterota bacterium]
MRNDLFKNPSSADFDLIEEIVTKYKLEDQFIERLDEDGKFLILSCETAHERGIYKSLYEDFFPYTEKLWEEVFLVINNKLPINLIAADFEKRSGLPREICEEVAKDIAENPTIQREIKAIKIEEDYKDFEEFPESPEDLQEMKDEKAVANIERNLQNGNSSENGNGLGLGQELLK